MGFIDWLILAILVFFTIQGFLKGFIATLVRIGGAIVTFLLIGQIFPLVRNSLIVNLHLGRVLSSILAVILLVIIILVLIRLIAWLITRLIKAMHLSFPNKLLGMIFGFANGILIV
ncbi:MAG: CvpA family protein, partial [Candidatus Cloacimonetes bacterium]|nr:CvpA family protein [Candidatus Cloacimonadota bacterium]